MLRIQDPHIAVPAGYSSISRAVAYWNFAHTLAPQCGHRVRTISILPENFQVQAGGPDLVGLFVHPRVDDVDEHAALGAVDRIGRLRCHGEDS